MKRWKVKGWIKSKYSKKDVRYNKISYRLINELIDLNIENLASSIDVPTLVMHGTTDKEVLPSQSRLLYRCLGSKDKKIKLIDGVDHWYHGKREEMQQIIVDWIKKTVLI